MGACAGGVWRTTDGGIYWENLSDGYFTTAAIGSLAVAPSEPAVIYVGTGETCIRNDVSHGDGIYRTTDGGRTWTCLGLSDTRHIGAIVVHPTDPDIAFVAALGHAWGPNPERGVYRTADGGRTWDQSLFRSPTAGAIDISIDPGNPDTLFAALWDAQRGPHYLRSGGPDSSLYRSIDGGASWEDLTARPGLPSGILGKIGVAVSPSQPGRVWALIEAVEGGLYRSDDNGETWNLVSDHSGIRGRPWYYTHLVADPVDADTIWSLSIQSWKTVDGGTNWSAMPTPHSDNHDLWIDPHDPCRMILGNDGGASVSFNGGYTWSAQQTQPTAQLYHVTTDRRFPYRLYASQQDNTAISLPSLSYDGVITVADWIEPGGGESGYIAVQPHEPHLVFGGAMGMGPGVGKMIAYDPQSEQRRDVTIWPEDHGIGSGVGTDRYRFQWTFPIMISSHPPHTLYATGNHVFCSRDSGSSWEVISPDLTRNDPSKTGSSGGPITRDNSGAETYCTIFAFCESPLEPGLFWAGSDDGLIHLSRDGGRNWQDVTPPELGEWALVSVIEPSPHDPAAAYVAATRYKLDDPTPLLLKTSNYGASWNLITTGIRAGDITRVVREDPERRGLLFAGTETGVYLSLDDGDNWRPFSLNLPTVPIYDLVIHDSDLIAATHGRSLWILDDITPLRQLEVGTDQGSQLFAPRPALRLRVYKIAGATYWQPAKTNLVNYSSLWMAGPVTVAYVQRFTPDGRSSESYLDAGQNPPDGLIVNYILSAEDAVRDVRLSFLDMAGKTVAGYESTKPAEDGQRVPTEVGLNRFVWSLGTSRPVSLRGPGGDALFKRPPFTPRALPGSYEVVLTIGDKEWREPFQIVPDPRCQDADSAISEQFELLSTIRDRVSEIHTAVNCMREARQQLANHNDLGLGDRLASLEDQLLQTSPPTIIGQDGPAEYPNRLREKYISLANTIDNADAAPTRQAREVFAILEDHWSRLSRDVTSALAEIDRLA
jgi:photosystem II stability/assembly factor-like uncharacterized protein